MTYAWKGGFPSHGVPASLAANRCEEIRRKHKGLLTPEAIVADAKSKESPLHPIFEWNDKKAAHTFRVEQARGMLRAIVTTLVGGRTVSPVRAFVAVTREGDDEKSYSPITVALEDPHMRAQVLVAAKAELASWRDRYRELEELSSIFETIDHQLRLSA